MKAHRQPWGWNVHHIWRQFCASTNNQTLIQTRDNENAFVRRTWLGKLAMPMPSKDLALAVAIGRVQSDTTSKTGCKGSFSERTHNLVCLSSFGLWHLFAMYRAGMNAAWCLSTLYPLEIPAYVRPGITIVIWHSNIYPQIAPGSTWRWTLSCEKFENMLSLNGPS